MFPVLPINQYAHLTGAESERVMRGALENFKNLNMQQNRHLTLACKRVSESWFPTNPDLLKKVSAGLKEGAYDLDPDFLYDEVSTDFGLFTYCLKGLSLMLLDEGIRLPDTADSIDLFRHAGPARLKKLLCVEPDQISSHALEDSSDVQAARLKRIYAKRERG